MKLNYSKILIAATFVAILLCGTASAQNAGSQNKKFGLGIIIGEPTGVSGKFWTGPRTAIDGAIAWSTGTHSDIDLHFDYLMHDFSVLNTNERNIILYYGIGTRFKFINTSNNNNNDTKVGIRIPLGITYLFPTAPFDIFAEIVPLLDLVPNSDFELDAGLGIRYYF
ncbi:MAG: DUF3996 domain-containing protein [bacterium]|nr:DUF3996 domain-containing protein [bacterium]